MSANLRSQPDDDDNQYILVAFVDNARILSSLLKAIHFRETATVCASADGLKVTVEDTKSVQGNAFIQASIFQDYVIREPSIIFKINLTVLLECLNIFGSGNTYAGSASLKICYEGYGYPLILLLQEGGVLTDCKLKTMDPEDIMDFEFTPSRVINKIIMKSEILKEAWGDLDMNSEHLEVLMSPNSPYFQLSTKGTLGTIHVVFSKESDMVESFHCTQTQTNKYRIFLIKPSLKALVQSSKISIRTDDRGFLCLQYMVKTEGGHVCFVEYVCTPDETLDDGA